MKNSNLAGGVILIVLGVIFLGNELDWFHVRFRDIARFWPLLLIGYGVYFLLRGRPQPPQNPQNF